MQKNTALCIIAERNCLCAAFSIPVDDTIFHVDPRFLSAALTALLPPEMLEGADGEFELDFESLDETTLRKIDVFLKGIFPNATTAAPAASRGRGASPDDDDDEEVSEGDLDDESDDD